MRPESRARLARWAGLAAIAIALAAAFIWYLGSQGRSFAVAATTRGADLVTQGRASNSWFLPAATICFRRTSGSAAPPPEAETLAGCDPRAFDAVPVENIEVEWPGGTRLRLSRPGPSAGFAIQVVAEGERPAVLQGRPLGRGSRLVVGPGRWPDSGTLVFSGELGIGDTPGTGSQYTLVEGSYQIREILPFRTAPTTTSQGTFFPADAVGFVDAAGRPVPIYGFFEPLEASAQGFRVTAYSPAGENRLVIGRFNAEDVELQSSWIERALSDSYFTGAAALFGMLSAMLSVVPPVIGFIRGGVPAAAQRRPRRGFRRR